MLTPDQIEALQLKSEQIIEPVVQFLIADIAQRIAEAGQLTSTAAYQVWRLQHLGVSQRQLKKELRKLLKVSHRDLRKLLTQTAEVGYNYDIQRFPYVQAVPFERNEDMQRIVEAAVKLADDEITNLTQTMGFVTPDGKANPLNTAYQKACDFAFEKVFTGAQDYNSAIREATKGLVDKGILRLDYENGVHRSVEAAVRGSVMGGLGLMQEQINKQNQDELGCDGWEISAHAASAPDHEPIQGKQYSDEEYQSLNNSLKRPIGTLNCGHSAFPIIMGVHTPQYTPEELEKFREDNEKGIVYNGKHYTMYEATQRQRSLERRIRKVKRRILVDEKLGDTEQLSIDRTKYVVMNDEYRRFSKAAGLRIRNERMEMTGFGPKQHGAAEQEGRDLFKRPPKNLEELSARVDQELDKYCTRESKWSSKTVVLTREQMPKANGRKEWNCDISLRNTAGIKTVIHEHLHARSISYYDPKTYLRHQEAEEATVELYAQEICKKNGASFVGAYAKKIQPLQIINNILRNGERFDFAKQLFDIPLPERYNWLRTQADELIATGKLSKKTVQSLNNAVEFFHEKDVK